MKYLGGLRHSRANLNSASVDQIMERRRQCRSKVKFRHGRHSVTSQQQSEFTLCCGRGCGNTCSKNIYMVVNAELKGTGASPFGEAVIPLYYCVVDTTIR